MSDDALVVPNDVYDQLEALRQSGAVNMITNVKHGLREMEFDEALDWVDEHQEEYMEHAMSGGFVPERDYDGDL